ncbi:MAG: hypothetical protein Q9203_006636 [Teloschistes exilis]
MQAARHTLRNHAVKPTSRLVLPRCPCRSIHHNLQSRRLSSVKIYPVKGWSQSLGRVAIGAVLSYAVGRLLFPSVAHAEAPSDRNSASEPIIFRLDDVRKHGHDAARKWITKGNKVYDITDWIPGHPGGEIILRAVGGSVDQYWNIFTIHNKQEVYDILESYCIGQVDPQDLIDGKVPVEQIDDPFKNDPERNRELVIHSSRPFNAETPADALNAFITPDGLFYVRQHMWVPEVDEAHHKIVIELADGEEKEYSLQELKAKFKEVTITATLQCSGNRRKHMTDEAHSTDGIQWNAGAISNAEWTGVRLSDVLKDAGLQIEDLPAENIKHVQFTGAEAYGASIPIEKAIDQFGDVLLVYAMNSQPLPLDHGYPLRLIAPGNVAARSVKWITRVRLSDEESTSQWQRRDYKCFGPNITSKAADWDSAPAIQETPVQSAITSVRDISLHSDQNRKVLEQHGIEEDAVVVEGYSYAGGGRRIIRVDVSADKGKTWHQANLLADQSKGAKKWTWTRWRWVLPKLQAGSSFVVKAVDEAYNTQAGEYEANYNFRGNLTSSWHRVEYGSKTRKAD